MAWSQACAQLPGARITAKGFGSQDCHKGCAAHLVYFETLSQTRAAFNQVGKLIGADS